MMCWYTFMIYKFSVCFYVFLAGNLAIYNIYVNNKIKRTKPIRAKMSCIVTGDIDTGSGAVHRARGNCSVVAGLL